MPLLEGRWPQVGSSPDRAGAARSLRLARGDAVRAHPLDGNAPFARGALVAAQLGIACRRLAEGGPLPGAVQPFAAEMAHPCVPCMQQASPRGRSGFLRERRHTVGLHLHRAGCERGAALGRLRPAPMSLLGCVGLAEQDGSEHPRLA